MHAILLEREGRSRVAHANDELAARLDLVQAVRGRRRDQRQCDRRDGKQRIERAVHSAASPSKEGKHVTPSEPQQDARGGDLFERPRSIRDSWALPVDDFDPAAIITLGATNVMGAAACWLSGSR